MCSFMMRSASEDFIAAVGGRDGLLRSCVPLEVQGTECSATLACAGSPEGVFLPNDSGPTPKS